jgi:hypothetical protein
MNVLKIKTKRMMVLLSILVSACATDTAENNETMKRLGTNAAKCILDMAKTIDDGISPADTVAVGVMSKCKNEIDAYDEVRLPAGAGFNIYATTVWNNRHTGWNSQITSIVLETRAAKKNSK